MTSKQVADFIDFEYDGAVVSVVDNTTDGYDCIIGGGCVAYHSGANIPECSHKACR